MRTSDPKASSNLSAYWQLTATAAIWGFSWLCGRVISTEGIPAIHGALVRFSFGSLGLLALMLLNRPWPRLTGKLAVRLALMGFCGVFLYNLCFFNGLKTVPAGRASLVASLQPSIVFLFSAIVWKERATVLRISGLFISLIGAAIVLSQGNPAALFAAGLNSGDLWILGCLFSWVAYTLLGRTVAGRLAPMASTAYSTWFGSLLLLMFGALRPVAGVSWSAKAWMAAAFLGIFGTTTAFLLYLKGVGQLGASRASVFINLVPVFGVLSATFVLREPISASTLIGGAAVVTGVRMLNR